MCNQQMLNEWSVLLMHCVIQSSLHSLPIEHCCIENYLYIYKYTPAISAAGLRPGT